jgi:hypothetical protein
MERSFHDSQASREQIYLFVKVRHATYEPLLRNEGLKGTGQQLFFNLATNTSQSKPTQLLQFQATSITVFVRFLWNNTKVCLQIYSAAIALAHNFPPRFLHVALFLPISSSQFSVQTPLCKRYISILSSVLFYHQILFLCFFCNFCRCNLCL